MPQQQGTQTIEFEGQQHQFPSDFSDAEIQQALSSHSPTPSSQAPQTAAPKYGPFPTQAPGTDTIGPRTPSMMDRLRSSFPIVDRIEQGLSGPAQSNQEALAKPTPGMQTEQAISPQNLMPSQQEVSKMNVPSWDKHIANVERGGLEFMGGMTTPGNMLLTGMTGGPLPPALARPMGAFFGSKMLQSAYQEYPDFKNAVDVARQSGNWNDVERIGTHLLLGSMMAAVGLRSAVKGESVYDQYSKDGRQVASIKKLNASKEGIETNGTGLYNQIRDQYLTHQGSLRARADDLVKDLVTRDQQQSGGKGTISPVQAITEANKTLASAKDHSLTQKESRSLDRLNGTIDPLVDQTVGNYYPGQRWSTLNPEQRAAVSRMLPPDIVPIGDGKMLSFEEAKAMRSSLGNVAFAKGTSAASKRVFMSAYDALTEGMQDRATELDGNSKRFDAYNKLHTLAYGLNDGVSGDMMQPLTNQDPQASIDPLKKYGNESNVKELTRQMRDNGNPQLANQVLKSQADAKALTAAHSTVTGKFRSRIQNLALQYPRESLPGLAALLALQGVHAGWIASILGGSLVAGANMRRVARSSAREIGGRLQSELPEEMFDTRGRVPDANYSDVGGGSSAAPSSPAPAAPSAESDVDMATRRPPPSDKEEASRSYKANMLQKIRNAPTTGEKMRNRFELTNYETRGMGIKERRAEDVENIKTRKAGKPR